MDTHPKIYLLRHGATQWSIEGRHTGVTDLPLIEQGVRNARKLAPLLHSIEFAAVFTSPLKRARQTCELAGVCEHAQALADLAEWNYGDYEGLTTAQVQEQRPGWSPFTHGCPNGETPQQVAERVDRLIEVLRTQQGNVAVFSHGHLLRVLGARWIGLPPAAGQAFLLGTASISVLGDYYGTPAIERWNAPLAFAP